MSSLLLSSEQLSIGYTSKKELVTILKNLNLEVFEGQFVCLLGPNGGGKSTLIKTLCGLQKALSGSVSICGKKLSNCTEIEKARTVGVILTDSIDSFGLTVREVINLGRIPYIGWMGKLSTSDHKIVDKVIQKVRVENMTSRPFNELSDGEKQRVLIGRALAQEPKVLFLDEPTAHLDLTWRVEVMMLLRDLCHNNDLGVVMSSHDFDLALRLADEIWMIDGERQWFSGIPEELALQGVFNNLFKSDYLGFKLENGSWEVYEEFQDRIHVSGEGSKAFWTKKLMERLGYTVGDKPEALTVEVENKSDKWTVKGRDIELEFNSLQELSKFKRLKSGIKKVDHG